MPRGGNGTEEEELVHGGRFYDAGQVGGASVVFRPGRKRKFMRHKSRRKGISWVLYHIGRSLLSLHIP